MIIKRDNKLIRGRDISYTKEVLCTVRVSVYVRIMNQINKKWRVYFLNRMFFVLGIYKIIAYGTQYSDHELSTDDLLNYLS